MTAQELIDKYGDSLIGRRIWTQVYGDWPGGLATVIELRPDFSAPEILFDVRADNGYDDVRYAAKGAGFSRTH